MAKSASTAKKTPDSWLHRHMHIVRHRPRFSMAAVLFLVLAVTLTGAGFHLARGMLIAFDAAALIFLAGVVVMFLREDVAQMRAKVAEQDAGRWGVLWISVAVSSVALVALGVELHASKGGGVIEVALAAGSLLLAWLFLNTVSASTMRTSTTCGRSRSRCSFPATGSRTTGTSCISRSCSA